MKREDWQIYISLLTLIVTPIASGIVVYFQLNKSHLYWVKQQRYIYEQELTERKFDLCEKYAFVLGRLNTLLLDQQVFLYSLNEINYILNLSKNSKNADTEKLKSEYERYKTLSLEQNDKIRHSLSEVVMYNYTGKAFFGKIFEQKALRLLSILKKAQEQVIPMDEFIQIADESISSKGSNETVSKIMGPIFDSRWNDLHIDESFDEFLNFVFDELKRQNNE